MNDSEWEAKKAPVKLLFDKWIYRLGLQWYKIDVDFKASDAPDRGDNFVASANCVSRWMYRTAKVTIYLEDFPEDPWEQERVVIHELIHILVEPMRDHDVGCTDNEEYVVECLTRAMLWTEEASKSDALSKVLPKASVHNEKQIKG